MKILHIVHQYPPDFMGGTELLTRSLATGQAKAGHDVAVLTRIYKDTHGLDVQSEEGVSIYHAWNGDLNPTKRYVDSFGNTVLTGAASHVIFEFVPDVVHIQHLMGWPLSILKFLQQRRIPYVVTLHDYWWFCANAKLLTNYSDTSCDGPQLCLNCTRCAVARAPTSAAWAAAPLLWGSLHHRNRKLRSGLDGASKLIALSESVRDWHTQHGVDAHQIQLIRTNLVLPPQRPMRQRQDDTIRFLYVGGLEAIKGAHIVVEALKGVQGNVELHIAGDAADASYRTSLEETTDPRVRFLGRLDREAVWQAYADSDVVVIPSLLHETFCLVAHEALAAGIPIIASNLAALPEAVEHGSNGLLVEPGRVDAWRVAMQQIVDDASWQTRKIEPRILLPTENEMVEAVGKLYADVVRAA